MKLLCPSLWGSKVGFVVCVIPVLGLIAPYSRPDSGTRGYALKTFEESARLIRNPDCGWIAYNYEDSFAQCQRAAGGLEPYLFASVVYTRHPRIRWGSRESSFATSAPVKLLEDWIEHERYVAFRVYANERSHIPPDLRRTVAVPDGGDGAAIDYRDEDYIEDHTRLINYLGSHFGHSPYLAFVDIGGVGDTGGEWYLSSRKYSGQTMYNLVERFVRIYEAAFPQTRLFISYDCVSNAGEKSGEVIELLRDHDIGLRDDGLGGWPYPRTDPPLDEWPMPVFWRDVPVCFEGSGTGGGVYGWTRQAKDPEHILQWAFRKCRPTYINLGGSETASARACSQMGPLLIRYGQKLGYRFVLLQAAYPIQLEHDRQYELRMKWANRGMAPCYVDRKLEISLHDSKGKSVAKVAKTPQPKTLNWGPEEITNVKLPFATPKDVPPGQYTLKIRMLRGDPPAPQAPVEIATKGADRSGRFTAGIVSVIK